MSDQAETTSASAPAPAASSGAAALPEAPPKRAENRVRPPIGFFDSIFLAIDNPILRRELLTALRSNKSFVLQFIFLLVLVCVVSVAWPEGEVSTMDYRARTLFHIYGIGQLVMIAVLAPAFSASAMTIEKEKQCLDLLLTSPVRPNTILMGKYLSSVLYIFLLVLSTAPLVFVCIWLPGIDPWEVSGLYVLLLSVAAAFGMVGLTCSTFFHRTQTSLSITYLIVLPLALVLLVLAHSFDTFFVFSVAIWPSALLLISTVLMYQACSKRLRQPFNPVFKAAEEEDISTQTGLVLVRDRFPDNLLAPQRNDELLPDSANPIYQKEIRSEIFGRGTLFLRLIIQISMFLSVVFLTFLYLQKEYVFVDYLLVFTMLVAPAFACNTFTQERERGTLDLLLTTLIRPSQIVTGKFISCCRLSLFLTGLIGITLLFFPMVGGGQSGGGGLTERLIFLLFYLIILIATILMETALGMFFSLVSRSTMQSMILTYSSVLLLFGAPIAVKALLTLTMTKEVYNQYRSTVDWACFSSPFQAVYSVSLKTQGTSQIVEQQEMIWPAYVIFALGLTVVLMGSIYTSFERWSTKMAKMR